MLYDIDRNLVTTVPHETEYRAWISNLSDKDLAGIRKQLTRMITDSDIHTSSWMPGEDWTGTPFEPIYETACGQSFQKAGWCFGLILWELMMEREEAWCFIKDPDREILGTTYFRVPDLDDRTGG